MIKGIILDVDGTILETLSDIKASLNIVLNEYGFESRDYDQVRLAIGKGSKKLVEASLPEGVDSELVEEIADKYLKVYGTHYNIETKPYDGIKELLNELENKGIILGVNTNKPDAYAKDLIAKHFPGNKFIEIYGAVPGVPNKPDPTSSNELVKKMGFKKEEVLYIGDSESDVMTAKNAGLKCIGCLWGFRDLDTLTKAGADYIVKNPKEILDILWVGNYK